MDDLSAAINSYNAAAEAARIKLEAIHGVPITPLVIQELLADRLDLTYSVDLIRQDLTPEKILSILRDFDFKAAHTEVIAEVSMEEDILPDGVLRLLTEAEATVNNQIWRVHKGDADPFPFDPHAHNVETGTKLDLRNGHTYKKRKYFGSIKRNHLLQLREKLEAAGVQIPALTR